MHKIPNTRTMSCGLLIKQGSKHEDEKTNGLSHLIEHLMLNVEGSRNSMYQQLINEATFQGVVYNAATTKESTSFYFTGLANSLECCIRALSVIAVELRNFKAESLSNEKKVVIQEATSFYSSFNQIKERISQALWGNVGIGKTIVGDIDNIKGATMEQLSEIIQSSYTPENACLVIIGDIDYTKALNFVVEYLSKWEDQKARDYEEVSNSETGIYFKANNGNNSVLSVGFRAPAFNDDKRIGAEIVSTILGDTSLESRLVQEIRVKRGLAYNLGSFTAFYETRGTMGFTVVCGNNSIKEVVKVIMEEIYKVKEKGFTELELKRAKKVLETKTILEINDLVSQLKFLGKCALNGQLFSLEHEIRRINKIEVADLFRISEDYFTEDNLGFAGIGNFNIDEIISILKF